MNNDDVARLWHMSHAEEAFGTLTFNMAATILENPTILRNKVVGSLVTSIHNHLVMILPPQIWSVV
jgi:hypothetical protein